MYREKDKSIRGLKDLLLFRISVLVVILLYVELCDYHILA